MNDSMQFVEVHVSNVFSWENSVFSLIWCFGTAKYHCVINISKTLSFLSRISNSVIASENLFYLKYK